MTAAGPVATLSNHHAANHHAANRIPAAAAEATAAAALVRHPTAAALVRKRSHTAMSGVNAATSLAMEGDRGRWREMEGDRGRCAADAASLAMSLAMERGEEGGLEDERSYDGEEAEEESSLRSLAPAIDMIRTVFTCVVQRSDVRRTYNRTIDGRTQSLYTLRLSTTFFPKCRT